MMMEKRESHRQTLCSSSSSSIGREPKAPAHEFSNPKKCGNSNAKREIFFVHLHILFTVITLNIVIKVPELSTKHFQLEIETAVTLQSASFGWFGEATNHENLNVI